MINCPSHSQPLALDRAGRYTCAQGCWFDAPESGVIDLAPASSATSDHYSLQWGSEVDFGSFYRHQREGLTAMTSRQMGWPALIARIRERARTRRVRLLDAACGYGGLFGDLFEPPFPEGLTYIGADVHGALGSIARPDGVGPDRALFVRWDISDPLPTSDRFDVIVCRAAIHHTPDPERTFRNLATLLAPEGLIVITAYAKKPPMREAVDDALRADIVPMPPREALALARQFTRLGRDLEESGGTVVISEDLPFLQIKAGCYTVHEFIYDHFLKCWFNERFGERYSDIVNFDWYHPPYAFRYEIAEIQTWFAASGLEVIDIQSTKAQHYVEGRRPAA